MILQIFIALLLSLEKSKADNSNCTSTPSELLKYVAPPDYRGLEGILITKNSILFDENQCEKLGALPVLPVDKAGLKTYYDVLMYLMVMSGKPIRFLSWSFK